MDLNRENKKVKEGRKGEKYVSGRAPARKACVSLLISSLALEPARSVIELGGRSGKEREEGGNIYRTHQCVSELWFSDFSTK